MLDDNDTYLEEVQKRTIFLMKYMLTVWVKNQQETEFTCVAKRKYMCWHPLDKVVALTISPAANPGTINDFVDIGQ